MIPLADRQPVSPLMTRREARVAGNLLRMLMHSAHPACIALVDSVLKPEGATVALGIRCAERLEGAALTVDGAA